MSAHEVVARFNTLYLGDSLLHRVELRIATAECDLTFDGGKILRHEGASIFEPVSAFAPALLRLIGVESISCEGGDYQLNSTVVDFGAFISTATDRVDFYLDLTGGSDPNAFLVKVRFRAKNFEFGAGSH